MTIVVRSGVVARKRANRSDGNRAARDGQVWCVPQGIPVGVVQDAAAVEVVLHIIPQAGCGSLCVAVVVLHGRT